MHFFDLMQPMFVNGTCPGKSWKKDFGVLENPGIWSMQALESPGKKHFYICTNSASLNSQCWMVVYGPKFSFTINCSEIPMGYTDFVIFHQYLTRPFY